MIKLLEDQKQKEGIKLKCIVTMDGDFTQVTLSWLPVKGTNTPVNSRLLHGSKPMEYKNMRKKAPFELRRDRARREVYLKEKQTVANKVDTSKAMNSKTSQVKSGLSCMPLMTRSRSKANVEIEVPRMNDPVCEDLFISPEKCDPSYDSVLSTDPPCQC